MRDDAVAPVVAAMLILAVVVTCYAAWNAYYIPSSKAQSEVGHLKAVETAILHFSDDIAAAASLKRNLALRETIPLGGGDTAFDTLSSAGMIRVNEEPRQLYNITIRSGGSDLPPQDGRLINFSYTPIHNYWIDQGYVWHYGYVNVTKGSLSTGVDRALLSTPLVEISMSDVRHSETLRAFARSLILVEDRPWANSTTNVSVITLTPITYRTRPGATFASSNGAATLEISAIADDPALKISPSSQPEAITVYVNRVSPDIFSRSLYVQCNRSFSDLAGKYPGNLVHTFDATHDDYAMTSIVWKPTGMPFNVTHQPVVAYVTVH